MKNYLCLTAIYVLGFFVFLSAGAEQKQELNEQQLFGKLPFGWKVTETIFVPAEQLQGFRSRLGGKITKISNTNLSIQGQFLKVNLLSCQNENEAKKVYQKISTMKSPEFVILKGSKIVEFVGESEQLAKKCTWELGINKKPKEIRYKISFDATPIKNCDYMSWNKFFNLFLAYNTNPYDENTKNQIKELSQKFKFSKEIDLRMCSGDGRAVYKFKPGFSESGQKSDGEINTYVFDNLLQKEQVPYVSIEAEVTTSTKGFTASKRKAGEELLAATAFWPVEDEEIKALANKITENCQSQQEKVDAILDWLRPNKNIRFYSPIEGSRYGVKKVLSQRYGHCWDFADCFITLARSAGIPCRQVAGWLYGTSGHIWAEVLIEDKGWQQVDATGGNIVKCDIYHIPYLISEDGDISLVYLSMPKIEVLKQH